MSFSSESMNRRDVLRAGLAVGAFALTASTGLVPSASGVAPALPAKGKRILILGGTGFLGPACSEVALERGHTVTLFNRGKTEERRKQAGRPSQVPDGVEVLYGNRDPEKTASEVEGDTESPKGLIELEGKTWDAVIDTSGYWPRIVKASAETLAPSVGHYLFVSTFSVYTDNSKHDRDESDTIGTLSDPTKEEFGEQFENYGPGKADCERAAEAAMPGKVTVVRPGFIVGRRDTSKRFLYWPVRASRGGTMIVPGTPTDPIQVVDVRDLAAFIIHCIEQKKVDTYNISGHSTPMREFIEGVCAGAGSTPAKPVWVSAEKLQQKNVEPTAHFPLWLPPDGETGGFHRRSIAKALSAGLSIRPIKETCEDSLKWYGELSPELQGRVIPTMLTKDQELELSALA